jgi:hypothetical protein
MQFLSISTTLPATMRLLRSRHIFDFVRNVRRGDGENVRLAGAVSIIRSLKPFRGRLF